MLEAVTRVLQRIAENPEAFPKWRGRRMVRRAVLRRFPFVVFFRETAGHLIRPTPARGHPLRLACTGGSRKKNIAVEIARGAEALRAAEVLVRETMFADAVSRAYYAAFHHARASSHRR